LLAIPSTKKKDLQDILKICAKTGCQLKTVPALYEIMEKRMEPVAIRDVDIIDLLGRDEINLNVEEISGYLQDKTVLVTGGGGSIGSELCRQIAYFNPKKLIIFDIYENNAYDLQNELLMRFKDLNLEVLIGAVELLYPIRC
jgi:FlaA1/EpsC-like NDP-sugar epimerase